MVFFGSSLHFDLLYLSAFTAAASIIYCLIRIFLINGITCPSKARIDGKTVVITGGNTGIGKETALELACRGGRIIIGCRDVTKGSVAVSEIKKHSQNQNVSFKHLDLASKRSIKQFSQEILEQESRIDILVLNAGVMFTPYSTTEDGFELQFGVNHLGHFFLTYLLLDRLKSSSSDGGGGRVVVVSSLAHVIGYLDFKDMMWNKRWVCSCLHAGFGWSTSTKTDPLPCHYNYIVYGHILIQKVSISGNRLYTEVSSFQGVGIEEFHCIQRCPHFRGLE